MNRHSIIVLLWGLAAGFATTGCQTYRDQTSGMRAAWLSGEHAEAARQFDARAKKRHTSPDGVLWHLEAATALRAQGSYTESNAHFDQAADRILEYERKAELRLGNEAGALFSNQQNLPYEGRSYDKILLHTYKALNYLALGEIEKARPELIRAYQRQQDAVADNARRIEQARAEAEQGENSDAVRRTMQDPGFSEALAGIAPKAGGFKVYADYVNPFAVYLDGLYFSHAGGGASDRERALKSLDRVAEMLGTNSCVQADRAQLAAGGEGALEGGLTYVVFETGSAPTRAQERIDVPILVADVSYVGMAFPRLEYHGDHADFLTVAAGSRQTSTELVASMDSIVALDFEKEWPTIVTKSVISGVAKAAAAYALNATARQQDDWVGLFARLATAAYQAAVNIADTRSWSTLPKQFQVARLPTPPDRKIVLTTTAGHREELPVVDGVVNVVYVRCVRSKSPLLISQFKLR